MKGTALPVAVLCAWLAAPATASDEPTHVVPKAWKVTLNENDATTRAVAPGGTFTRCPGDIVTRLRFRGKMTHPSRKGVEYDGDWRHNGLLDAAFYGFTTEKHGVIRQSFGTEGHQDMGNGKWAIRFRRHGKRIGSSSIRIRTASAPDC